MEKDKTLSEIEEDRTSGENIENTSNEIGQNKPWLTIFIGLICIILFVGINSESQINSWDIYFKWGAPSANDIWNGHIWGLLTSNFLHVDFFHLICNLYWLWIFGKKIEAEISNVYYLFLIISAGFIASIFELAFSDSTGIGFSGIGYAMFGFIFINSKLDKSDKWVLEQKTITFFFFWLFFCVLLSYAKIWPIGNFAHFSGLLWGVLIGYLATVSNLFLKFGLPLIIFGISAISILWSPWSLGWLSNQAFNHHQKQNYAQAKIYYSKVLEKDAGNSFALENLKQIKILELSNKVKELVEKQDFVNAKKVLNEIFEIDPNDKWANEVLLMLP